MSKRRVFLLAAVSALLLVCAFGCRRASENPKKDQGIAGSIAIEVGLVMHAGNVEMVARTPFALLRRDAVPVLVEGWESRLRAYQARAEQDPRLTKVDLPFLPEDRDKKERSVLEAYCDNQRLEPARRLLQRETIQTLQTDFNGKAEFTHVPAGKYFIFGIATFGGQQCTLWNVPVEAKANERVAVVLDQNNRAGGPLGLSPAR